MSSLAVCVASSREPCWPFTFSLYRMAMVGKGSFDSIGLAVETSFATDNARCRLAQMARQGGCSHILFLDDDMSFPHDTAERLFGHDKAVVAANYTSRVQPIIPLAANEQGRVFSKGKTGLEQVTRAPTGVMMIDTRVFAELEMPWFKTEYVPEEPFQFLSDDSYFCDKAREAGFEIWIDHDLSNQVGHVGSLKFQFDHSMTQEPPEVDGRSFIERVRDYAA